MTPPRWPRAGALLATFALVSLSLSTAAHEVATALLLAWSLASGNLRARGGDPWMPAAWVLAAAWTLSSLASGVVREGIGHAWLLAPLLAFPERLSSAARNLGLAAAVAASTWGVGQYLLGGEGRGGFSHHLSLAYALLPPLAVALHDRAWWAAVPIALGVLSTRSDAAPLAMLATGVAVALAGTETPRGGPLVALRRHAALTGWTVGAAATLAGTWLLADRDELRQRAILWTGGLAVPPGTAGAGGYGTATEIANDALWPGFYFPHHAHDTLVQLAATTGMAGLVALLCLAWAVFRRAHPAAAAGLAGVLVGGLTQDTLGDLEVARAAWTWVAILGTARQNRGQDSP